MGYRTGADSQREVGLRSHLLPSAAEQPIANLGMGEGRQRECDGLYHSLQCCPGCPRASGETSTPQASAPSIPQKSGLTALSADRQQCTQQGMDICINTCSHSSQVTCRGPTGGTLQPHATRGVQTPHLSALQWVSLMPGAGRVYLALVHAWSSQAMESSQQQDNISSSAG